MAANRNLWRPEPRKAMPSSPMIIQPPGTRSVNAPIGANAASIAVGAPPALGAPALTGEPGDSDGTSAEAVLPDGTSPGAAGETLPGVAGVVGPAGVTGTWVRSDRPRLDPVVAVSLTDAPPSTAIICWPPPTSQRTTTAPVLSDADPAVVFCSSGLVT